MDLRRHAPVGRWRPRRPSGWAASRGLRQVYRGRRKDAHIDLLATDHPEQRTTGRFRWLFSTFLAATVGTVAIAVAIIGSFDRRDGDGGILPALMRMREEARRPPRTTPPRQDGLKWASPKADRVQVTFGGASTRHVIHDSMRQRRGNRDFILQKPYARIVARLSSVPASSSVAVPPFNPLRLYANTEPATEVSEGGPSGVEPTDVTVRVVELIGGILPGDDGQELDQSEVQDIIDRARDTDASPLRPAFVAEGAEHLARKSPSGPARPMADEPVPPNTTVLAKTVFETEDTPDEEEAEEVTVVRVQRGDTVTRVLTRLKVEPADVRAAVEALKPIIADGALESGQELHIAVVPSLTHAERMDLVRLGIYTEAQAHRATVIRNEAGELVASSAPISSLPRRVGSDDQASSLYASIYHAALSQQIPPDTITSLLRIHAYETDFRRRIRPGDAVEMLFDLREDDYSAEGPLGDLLFTAIQTGGSVQRFYRFRGADGQVDYYDEHGNNSRKFLDRRPVRGEEVRLTSGFGMRFHPLFNDRRMHTGIDLSAPTGTPILAAGNGVIEEIGRKAGYGNYIRIRHANGYKTTYGHLSRFAPALQVGSRVRIGNIIGAVGCTGTCSGAHLHFEVLVNSRFVDPMRIEVPREKQLAGKDLIDFRRERARIDNLLTRPPVKSRTAPMEGG